MSQYNDLSIEIYSSGTTLIIDPGQELRLASDIGFTTQYPGGLYGSASFFIPHKVTGWWEVKGGQRVVIRNKQRAVWEGYISNLESVTGPGGYGIQITCIGAWGHSLMNWQINKAWADTGITDQVWPVRTGAAEDKFTVDRYSRIQIIPKSVSFNQYDSHNLRYTMPTGQTVKRVKYDYSLVTSAAAPTWRLGLYDTVGAAWLDSVDRVGAGTTSGSVDHTLVTPRNYVEISLNSFNAAPQTPSSDGSVLGKFSNLVIYSETGNIYMDEIAKDLITYCTDLSTATDFIPASGSPLELVPYITGGYMTLAEILAEVTGKGDAAYARWAAYVVNSERATAPDGKPLLVVNAYPLTTDYEYAVSFSDINRVGGVSISQDFDNIANDIIVSFTDPNGVRVFRTSADLATLKDQTSIDNYDKHTTEISIGESTSAIADSIGIRYLAQYKDPQYHLSGPITIQSYIRGKAGNIIPASEVRARNRVRIENYLEDVTGTGQGLTFVVTQTTYDDMSEVCSLTTGAPLAPILLRYTKHAAPPGMGRRPGESGTAGGAGDGGRTVTDAMLAKMGVSRAKWAKMTPKQRRAAKKKAGL